MTNPSISYASLLVIPLLLFTACREEDPNDNDGDNPMVTLSDITIVGNEFIDEEGQVFTPWGLNYTNAEGVNLIEDQWYDNAVWGLIEEDFKDMKALGANIVRIHLQYHQFMLDIDTPNESSFDKLDSLVSLANENELYLDITGLAAYRKGDQPAFYDNLNDSMRWVSHKNFWAELALRMNGESAVFAYNLMNEPLVSVGCSSNTNCEWLPGDSFGGFHFVQNITRDPDNMYSETMKEWIATLTDTIRVHDPITPITFGVIDLGSYNQFAEDLDYLSPHIYPKSGEIEASVMKLMANASESPIVIEEIFNLHCSIEELDEFLASANGYYQGIMGHYSGISIDELDESDIVQAINKNFLVYFRDNAPK